VGLVVRGVLEGRGVLEVTTPAFDGDELVAVETGLRAGELRSLTRASFDLAGTPPTVAVEAAYSKRRRRDVLPLRSDMAATLKASLRGRLPKAKAFDLPGQTALLKAFKEDPRASAFQQTALHGTPITPPLEAFFLRISAAERPFTLGRYPQNLEETHPSRDPQKMEERPFFGCRSVLT